jgi:hypothetical protein
MQPHRLFARTSCDTESSARSSAYLVRLHQGCTSPHSGMFSGHNIPYHKHCPSICCCSTISPIRITTMKPRLKTYRPNISLPPLATSTTQSTHHPAHGHPEQTGRSPAYQQNRIVRYCGVSTNDEVALLDGYLPDKGYREETSRSPNTVRDVSNHMRSGGLRHRHMSPLQ